MAKRGISTGMTRGEKLLGIGLLAVYLFVLPLTADPMFDGIGKLFGTSLSEGMRNAAYHYILFALTLLVFGGFMVRTTRVFLDHPGKVLGTAGIGLVAFYGCNEIVWRVLQMVSLPRANLNDQAILAQISAAPRSTILILVFLSPVVEEALFRGYVFGNLREWPGGLCGQQYALCAAPRLGVRCGESGFCLLTVGGSISGSGAGNGLVL